MCAVGVMNPFNFVVRNNVKFNLQHISWELGHFSNLRERQFITSLSVVMVSLFRFFSLLFSHLKQ